MNSINLYQLGWFSTGRDKAARDLLTVVKNSLQQGEIKAEIAFVFCNREPGETVESDRFRQLVENYRLPLIGFSYQKSSAKIGSTTINQTGNLPPWRLDYDREVMKRLAGFSPDLCVLAGYMLIVGPEMCQRYKMINLHPAAPGGPSGTWQEVIWQLIDSGAQETGVMIHLVTPQLDKGPPVAYGTFTIRGEPFDRYWTVIETLPANAPQRHEARYALFKLIRKHGLVREFPLVLATIKAFSKGKIKITKEKQVIDAAGKAIKGYNLTDEIEMQVKED